MPQAQQLPPEVQAMVDQAVKVPGGDTAQPETQVSPTFEQAIQAVENDIGVSREQFSPQDWENVSGAAAQISADGDSDGDVAVDNDNDGDSANPMNTEGRNAITRGQ